MCRAHPELTATDGTRVDVGAACDTLARWDGRANADSAGAVLWSAFFAELGGDPAAPWWHTPYDPARPVSTPSGIDGAYPAVQLALADTVQQFQARHISLGALPGDTMRWTGIPLHGCDEDAGCFNILDASTPRRLDASTPRRLDASTTSGCCGSLTLAPTSRLGRRCAGGRGQSEQRAGCDAGEHECGAAADACPMT